MGAATIAKQDTGLPRKVKISSKRQLTIPVDIYERQRFKDYALLTETDEGLLIQPLSLADEDEALTLQILRNLMKQGFDGEELLEKYTEVKANVSSFATAIARSEADIAEGRVTDFHEMQAIIGDENGV